jgi:hypothetical protein
MALALLDEDATVTVKDDELGLEDGDDTVTYTLKVVTPQVIKRLRKAHTKRKPSGGAGMVDVLDTDGFGEALWDYVLGGWSNVVMRGKEIGPDEFVNGVKAKTLLDGSRKSALLERAGGNEVVDTDASFRPSA